ncbi:MAG: hypothetical protein EOM90_00310 [Alphaproteobacteria bacterium]|nr:hypothetical protein [Alphaproteobacteria bacterium]
MNRKVIILLLILTVRAATAYAWLYPEHREITLKAIVKLDSGRRFLFEQLWNSARKGKEGRLTIGAIDPGQIGLPTLLDYTAWPAIAGDHSTSSENMMYNILQTEWILKVADIAARLQNGLDEARNQSERVNRMRDSDIKLLRADPEYVSRAGGNNGHFLMALPDVNITAPEYFAKCFEKGCELNTIGIYTWFHISAIRKAACLHSQRLTSEQRSAYALSALADEAFALHFLEDSFTSGHIAGIWGDASQRKGTHDYYNEKGLEITTWQGVRMVLMGDAYMRPEDADHAAEAVLKSLTQFLDAAAGKMDETMFPAPCSFAAPDTFNVSKAKYMPLREVQEGELQLCREILLLTPIPGLATGWGELPRFRSELGPFIGIASAVRGGWYNGGFADYQTTSGVVAGLELALRLGLGMEGVLNESGDGLVFLDLGWRIDGASSMRFDDEPAIKNFGAFSAAIPSRDAYFLRLRMPFFLIPGDILIAGPILYLTSPKTFNKMVVAAGNGGLIPWQSGIRTPIGRFQFVIGREVGICMYGTGNGPDAFLMTVDQDTKDQAVFSLYTTQFDFPILEYRPMRNFSSGQSASLVFQFYGGFDIPGKRTSVYPSDYPLPDVKTTWFAGLRMSFDWRYYFSGRKNSPTR